MDELMILGAVGAGFVVFGLVMLLRVLKFKKNSGECSAEILSAEKDKRGRFTHEVKFSVDGREYQAKDTAGYSQDFVIGTKQDILYNKSEPEVFYFKGDIKTRIIAYSLCVILGAAFMIRFWL